MSRNAGNAMDEDAANAYLKVVELLDANPANMDTANGQLGLYKEAYMLLYVYYGNVAHDKARRISTTTSARPTLWDPAECSGA